MEVREEIQTELTHEILLEMYWIMLLSRRIDERAWLLHRQGKFPFHISAIGHEAAQAGAAFALERGKDWLVPYYRDLAMVLAFGLTPSEFALGLLGKKGEPSSGARQMPSHWGLRRANIVSTSSPVATQTPHAAGIGFAIKARGDDAVVLTSIGEGATSQGEWYEGVNWAAVHQLPVIFLVENNEYAISVPRPKQMAVANVAEKAIGLGLPGITVNGLDVIEVYNAVKSAADRARSGGGPTLIEATVMRMTPHSSDDDDRSYRSREEIEEMKRHDPVEAFRDYLIQQNIITEGAQEKFQSRAKEEVEAAMKMAEDAQYPDVEEASYPVYAEDIRHG